MPNLTDLSTSQLRRIVALKEAIEGLEGQIASIIDGRGGEIAAIPVDEVPKKRRMSASARAKIAAAQKARWARVKGTTATPKAINKKDGRSSAAFRAKMAAAAKARWKKAKAAGKSSPL